MDVNYTSTDPMFAAQAANAVARAYIDQSMEFRFSESKDATDFLSERLAEQRKALEASEAALQAYREHNGALSVTDSASAVDATGSSFGATVAVQPMLAAATSTIPPISARRALAGEEQRVSILGSD